MILHHARILTTHYVHKTAYYDTIFCLLNSRERQDPQNKQILLESISDLAINLNLDILSIP